MNVLLHICCANCACHPVDWLRMQGHVVRGLFFNPNIQPYQEYMRRRGAVEQVSAALDFPVIYLDEYPLEEFFRRMVFRENQRCRICYQWRLETASRLARRGKYEAWTTTLLFSKHQNHEMIMQIAHQEAAERGVKFLYADFREGWKRGQERSRALGLYRQSYCGCIYSERDRFEPAVRKGARGRTGDPVDRPPVAKKTHRGDIA